MGWARNRRRQLPRLAWCYGDAGIAAALLVAARSVHEEEWEQQALEITRRAMERSPKLRACRMLRVCVMAQPVSGTSLIASFRQPAKKVSVRRRVTGLNNLSCNVRARALPVFQLIGLPAESQEEYREDRIGILEGAAGIALALLAAVTDIEPS